MIKFIARCLIWVCAIGMLSSQWIPARAESMSVTVTILHFIQVEDPDPLLLDETDGPDSRGHGDYYAQIRIGSNSPQRNRSDFVESTNFQPFWSFSQTVDDSGTIPIVIRMWDADIIENNDDIIDLNPQDNSQALVLDLDLEDCTWTGDAGTNGTFAQGDGDTGHTGILEGGEAGKVLFDISCSQSGDLDGDGIPDAIERFGIRDMNGTLVVDMAALGTDPCRPNIVVEIDYMEGNRPSEEALERVKTAFDNAGMLVPTLTEEECPYPGYPATSGGGIGLIAVIDDMVEAEPETSINDVPTFRDNYSDPELKPYVHYNLWVNKIESVNLAGQCCIGQTRDFIIGLGAQHDDNIGGIPFQSTVFMHELGHTLGLSHGGGNKIDADQNGEPRIRNCKPNYLSIMNYVFAFSGIVDDDTGEYILDYSREKLPDLNENMLNEANGIGDGSLVTIWAGPDGKKLSGRGDGQLDFDDDKDFSGAIVDLTAVSSISGCAQDADGNSGPEQMASPGDTLAGWNDWTNIKFRGAMASGAAEPTQLYEERITSDEIRDIQDFWEQNLRCNPPKTGTWVIEQDCTIWRDVTAPGNVTVEDGVTLRVAPDVTLSVDFIAHALRVRAGGRVEIQAGGKIGTNSPQFLSTEGEEPGSFSESQPPASEPTQSTVPMGDVNCDDSINSIDALFVLQRDIGRRQDSDQCESAREPGMLYLPACDVNGDGECGSVDALFILQCDIGRANPLCPDDGVVSSQVSRITEGNAILRIETAGTTSELTQGDTFTVTVIADSDVAVGAVTASIRYDSAQFKAVSCQIGFDMGGCNPIYGTNNVRFNVVMPSGLSGSLHLVDITFERIGNGEASAFELEAHTFADIAGGALSVMAEVAPMNSAVSSLYSLYLPVVKR